MRGALQLVLVLFLVGCSYETVPLPPVVSADRIEVSGHQLPDGIVISDPERVQAVIRFINSFPDNWDVPWAGPPVAAVHLTLWNGRDHVANFGVSSDYVTRDYGNFWSQSVPREKVEAFALQIHPAIHEGAFTIVPGNLALPRVLKEAQATLEGVHEGATIDRLYRHIKDSGMEITADYDSFINVSVVKIREGQYADTVVAGQYRLNPDRSLQKVRFFGVEIRKRISSNKAVDPTPGSAPRDSGASSKD